MKYYLAFAGLLIATAPALAQLGANPIDNEQNLRALANLSPGSAGARTFDNRYEGVHGTPLLMDEMIPIEVVPEGSNEAVDGLSGNLDLEKKLLYVKFKDGKIGSLPAARIQRVLFAEPAGTRQFLSIPVQEVEGSKEEGSGFYEVLYEGQFLFLKLTSKTFRKANYQGAYSPDRRYDEYTEEIQYFLRHADGPYEKIKLREKALTKAFPTYEDDITKIAKAKKLDLDSEAGVIALLKELEEQ